MCKFKINHLVIMGIFFLMVIGCEKGSNTPVSVPNVIIDCQISACNQTVLASTALVLLSKSGCQNDYEIPAAATPFLTCTSAGCSAVASQWIDKNSNSVSELLSGSYDVCILIDTDNSGNTTYTNGDIIYEASIYISSGAAITASGSSWRVY